MSSATTEERVPYNENTNNGFIFNDEHCIPEEVLLNILSYYVDYKTLRSCQLVCKQWNLLIKNYVWHKKAELMLNRTLLLDKDAPWTIYYSICHNQPFNRNLITNHSGTKMFDSNHNWANRKTKHRIRKSLFRNRSGHEQFRPGHGSDSDWTPLNDAGHGWAVEVPPQGVPAVPDDPVFEGKNCCFVTSYGKCWKQQVIDLVKKGISEYILDKWQPTIKVSEWFSSHKRCGSVYACTTELTTEGDHILSHFNYSKIMRNEDQNRWFKFEYEFKNYGKGLRKIKFRHGGQDIRFWSGHFGSKMSGACVKFEVPDRIPEVLTPQENSAVDLTKTAKPYYPPDDEYDSYSSDDMDDELEQRYQPDGYPRYFLRDEDEDEDSGDDLVDQDLLFG